MSSGETGLLILSYLDMVLELTSAWHVRVRQEDGDPNEAFGARKLPHIVNWECC